MNRVFTLLIILTSTITYSQKLVETFNPKVRSSFLRVNARDAASAVDGGILVGGYLDFLNGENSGSLVKLDKKGQKYPGFKKVISDGDFQNVSVLPDGKILVCGNFNIINGTPSYQLARLNSDGSLDKTFTNHLPVIDFSVQSTGKIIVYDYSIGVKRLNSDGTEDNAFHGFYPLEYTGIKVSSDDFIFIQGYTTVTRLEPNGDVDNFNFAIANGPITAIEPLDNGKLMIGGTFSMINNYSINRLAKVNFDGTIDSNFILEPTFGYIRAILQRKSGNFVITGRIGSIGNTQGEVFEISSTGEIIEAIVTDNLLQFYGSNLIATELGEIILKGRFTEINFMPRNGLALFNADNKLNADFKPDIAYSRLEFYYPDISITPSGNVLVCSTGQEDGIIGTYQNSSTINSKVFRLDSLGVYDSSFVVSEPNFIGLFTDVEAQNDNKVVVSGSFVLSSGRAPICRFNPNGELDESFNVTIPTGMVRDIAIRDSIIYAAGQFNQINGVTTNSIVALDFNGNVIETSSSVPDGADVQKLAIQTDYKMIVVYASSPAHNNNFKIVRLNSDGTIDLSFLENEINGLIFRLRIDKNGRIYILGSFNNVNGLSTKNIIRLHPNGELDHTFSLGSGFSQEPLDIELLPDGNLVVGGEFTSYQGFLCHGLALISENGDFISSANFHLNRGSRVVKLRQSNGYLYAAGRIVLSDFQNVISIAKFNLQLPLDLPPLAPTNLLVALNGRDASLTWQDNSNNETGFIIERRCSLDEFIAIDTIASENTSFIDFDIKENLIYTYRLKAFNIISNSTDSNEASITLTLHRLAGIIKGEDGVQISDGSLVLYRKNLTGPLSLVQKIDQITSSDFSFSIDASEHTLYFIPDKSIDSLYVPTIFGKTLTLTNNNFVKISNDTTILFEILKVQSAPTASQVIEGNVYTGGSGSSGRKSTSKSARSSNEDIPVLLVNDKGNVVAITQTDADGNYSFNGLVAGTYQVLVIFELDNPICMGAPVSIDVSSTSKDLSFDFTSIPPTIKTKNLQSITFDSILPVDYTHDFIELVASSTSGLPVTYTSSNPAVATISNNTITIAGAGTTTIKAKQPGDTTYKFARDVDQILEVAKAHLTVTATNKTKKHREANPVLTFTIVGLKSGETEGNSGILLPSISTNAAELSDAGTYSIQLSGGNGGANYVLNLVDANLTVEKADQLITLNSQLTDVTSDHPAIELEATSTSGLPVSFSVNEGTDLVTLDGEKLLFTGKGGIVTIKAFQTGDKNYNPSEIYRSFNVNVVLGLEPQSAITFFPNPTSGILKIQSKISIKGIILLDILGKELKKIHDIGATQFELNLSDEPSGSYIIRVLTNDNKKVTLRAIRAD